MRVAAVDIGTNSMRLLIADGVSETGRWERITGLGRGVDQTGRLSDEAVVRTLEALAEYRGFIESAGVDRVRAIATSASRDASNREEFFDAVEQVLRVRPELISGDEEARLAFQGATTGWSGPGPVLVSDIGGGSTEFVTASRAVSVDIGSVRLTERAIPSRPAPAEELAAARDLVLEMFSGLGFDTPGTLIGVAGTWTEIPRLAGMIGTGEGVHGARVGRGQVSETVERLAGLTVAETARLTPAMRAPVILAGVIVAEGVMAAVRASEAVVSVHDTLDGVGSALLAQPQPDGLA
jgi:exopolyphosphatase / guanosine-5'-triphosphate,3'-diphosphate pyrophosphatase